MDNSYYQKFWKIFGLCLLFSGISGWLKFYGLGPTLGLNPQLTKYLTLSVLLLSYILYVWSHYLLAKAKGYSGWLTLLALVNVVGLVILIFLPNKQKK